MAVNDEPIIIRTDGDEAELVPCANEDCDVHLVDGVSISDEGLCTSCWFEAQTVRIIQGGHAVS